MPRGRATAESEERLIPVVRAALAERMAREGFSGSEIAASLRVSRSAVTQYLKKARGRAGEDLPKVEELVEPLAESVVRRARSGMGPIQMVELLETARHILVFRTGSGLVQSRPEEPQGDAASLAVLRERLQLELAAAEQYLQLANRTTDDYAKLLLRMIASDSTRHADVVSQVISWLESDGKRGFELPGRDILEGMLALEDSAKELSLRESVKVSHPVARLLLESIDIDEAKHGRMVAKMLALRRASGLRDVRFRKRARA